MTNKQLIELLSKARNILHKQENGKTVTSLDITLAHDCIDMVLDELVAQQAEMDRIYKDGKNTIFKYEICLSSWEDKPMKPIK